MNYHVLSKHHFLIKHVLFGRIYLFFWDLVDTRNFCNYFYLLYLFLFFFFPSLFISFWKECHLTRKYILNWKCFALIHALLSPMADSSSSIQKQKGKKKHNILLPHSTQKYLLTLSLYVSFTFFFWTKAIKLLEINYIEMNLWHFPFPIT